MVLRFDNFINLMFKYFHNLNEHQITNKNIVYMLMSMFYLQQICHALDDFSDFLVEDFENLILKIIQNSILIFQVNDTSDIIPKFTLTYIFLFILFFYIISNIIIIAQFDKNVNSFDTLKSFISSFDFINYFFLADIILNNSMKSLVCSNNKSVFLSMNCADLNYKIVFIGSILNIVMELIILLKYCYFCNTILINNAFPLCRNVCQIEFCVIITKIMNICFRMVDSKNFWVKFVLTIFNTFLYLGISLYILVYLPFHKRKSNYMTFYYNSFVFFFYLFILVFVLFNLKSMIIFLVVLFFANHSLSHHIFNYRVHSLILKRNISSVNKYYEIIFISNYFLELYENEFDHYSKAIKFGIICKHQIECTNTDCPLKSKEKLYFPISNEWSSEEKSVYEKTTFIFIIICILENFNLNYPNKFINLYLSELFLIFIGNTNKTLFYFYKFRGFEIMKLELFHFVKLAEDIQNEQVKKLKDSRESKGFSTEEIDIMQYFKITTLYENLQKNIHNFLRNSDKFWKNFTESSLMILNLNKLYKIASEITKDLKIIRLIWKNISKISSNYLPAVVYYSEFLVLLEDYFELKQLDYQNKKDILTFNNQNYYSLLFNHENFIVSIRGNPNKFGEISYVSSNSESFINYKPKELLLQKIEMLIPQPIGGKHNSYLKRYFEIGYHVKINKITSVLMLKKNEDPIWATAFIKYYPSLGEEIFYVGLITRSELKNNLVIYDDDFNLKYFARNILMDYNFDLNNYKKSKIEVPFYLICPNVLKYFKIDNKYIYNRTNMAGDLNQVILDLFIPPIFEAMNKEILLMRCQSNEYVKDKEESSEIFIGSGNLNESISVNNENILLKYKKTLQKLSRVYHMDKLDEVFGILKQLYSLKFAKQDNTIFYIKVKIEFHNYTYQEKKNIIVSDIKVLSYGHIENVDEIFLPKDEVDDLCFQETSNNEQSNNIEHISPLLKILEGRDSFDDDDNSFISHTNKNDTSMDILLSKNNFNTKNTLEKTEQEEVKKLIKNNKKVEKKPKKKEIAQAPNDKDKSVGLGNTASVNSTLVNLNSLTNFKKIINDAKEYETDSLKLAFVITKKIFPLILISFQLFLYLNSLNIISSYQVFLNFYSQKFRCYYEILTLTNYLSLAEFFINQNKLNNKTNTSNPQAIYSNYTKSFETNIYENFGSQQKLNTLINNKYLNLTLLKSQYNSFEWLQQDNLYKISETYVDINISTTFNDHSKVDSVNLDTGLYNLINMINKFLNDGNNNIIHDIMFNLYSSIIPNSNRLLKTTLSDLLTHIQSDERTFTLVFIISIICILTSGSLNYYTYIKIQNLVEKTFILIKDVQTNSIKNYIKKLDDFTKKNDENESDEPKEENGNKALQESKSKKSKKKSKFYIKKLNLIYLFFPKLVLLMVSLCVFFCLNYFLMIQYMENQQTFLTLSNFLFVMIYNNTLTKIQVNEILKNNYTSLVMDNKEFFYTYDNFQVNQNFYIQGSSLKNDELNTFFNTFLIQNFCNASKTYNVTSSPYCSNPQVFNYQYEFGLNALIDNYIQYYQSIKSNTIYTNNIQSLFFSNDYKQFCFYYYDFIEDQIMLPITMINNTYTNSSSTALIDNHLIFSFFILSLFIILSYFTTYFLTRMKNVLNDCKDFMVHLPNNFFQETSTLKRFLLDMANEIKMQSNV